MGETAQTSHACVTELYRSSRLERSQVAVVQRAGSRDTLEVFGVKDKPRTNLSTEEFIE